VGEGWDEGQVENTVVMLTLTLTLSHRGRGEKSGIDSRNRLMYNGKLWGGAEGRVTCTSVPPHLNPQAPPSKASPVGEQASCFPLSCTTCIKFRRLNFFRAAPFRHGFGIDVAQKD